MAGQLIRRGENAWCVRVFIGRDAHGKRSYINQTVHGTKRDADQELRRLLAQRDTGRLHVKPKQSVDEYLDVWLETVVRPSVRTRNAARLRGFGRRAGRRGAASTRGPA